MKWSWKLGRFAGIDVRVHATFLILLAWIAVAGYRALGTVTGALGEVLFVLALFASVVLHEYGHALTARRYGVATREITLLPIGGVAQLDRIPTNPRQELAIAVAGPAVTVVLVIVLWLVLVAVGGRTDAGAVLQPHSAFLSRLLWANIILAVFNVLPAFPMDGGRILRAALAMRMDYARATRIAAEIGKLFALLFGAIGLFSNPWLVLIALFVWLGAVGESQAVQTRSMFEGVPVERVMIRDVRTLAPDDPLSRAAGEVVAGFQQDFPVVRDGTVVGVLTRADLMRALAGHGAASRVSDAMQRDFQVAAPNEDLDRAFARLQACRCHTFPVVQDGRLVGVLTAENVGEFMMVQSAIGGRPGGGAARKAS
ncbi:MAG TPA: site-2 protease family protein [Gemmatimonadaceae bacterium]